ncbi:MULTISPECIES: hypothetical protein [Natrialbaceae]|uniref:hypothetical protein n=1 Tax=Natrialbaceae TaxID=1644061 RepID=UPI00207CBD71|nr:hypothetical protein [Natronococcus sp. CG52]
MTGEPTHSDAERDGGSDRPADPRATTDEATGGLSDRAAFWIAAVTSVVVAVGSVWLFQGPFYQTVMRVRPTVGGGGIGSEWVAGNTEPVLNALIALIHFADVIMGIFIIVMVVIHWAAFRRLADRMQPPRSADADVATDGGERTNGERERSERDPRRSAKRSGDGSRSSSEVRSDGGEPSETRRTSEDLESSGSDRSSGGDRA